MNIPTTEPAYRAIDGSIRQDCHTLAYPEFGHAPEWKIAEELDKVG